MSRIVSECCELMKLYHICYSGPVFFETCCSLVVVSVVTLRQAWLLPGW